MSGSAHGQERTPPRSGRAPAKLILFGEHAVGYGQPALGCALSRGVRVQLSPGSGRVRVQVEDGLLPARARVRGIAPTDLVHAALGPAAQRTDAEIWMEVPPGAGLGTSAALAIALLRAVGAAESTLLSEAVRVEDLAHGKSSGLDPAISLSGSIIAFTRLAAGRRRRIRAIHPAAPLDLVVGVHGTHGGTRARVEAMAKLKDSTGNAFTAAIRALGAASRLGAEALAAGDGPLFGRAMDLAHGILAGLGVVSDPIEELVRCARAAGALGAKMSGAGGGGAFYALAQSRRAARTLRDRLISAGAVAWIESIGVGE
jgi:mevalonate kinase